MLKAKKTATSAQIVRDQVLSYNLANRMHFIKGAWMCKVLMEKLLDRLDNMPPKKVPFLFPMRGNDCEKGKNCFDLFIRKR